MYTSHSPCRLRQKSRPEGRATSSVNPYPFPAPNIMVRIAVHTTCHRTPSSQPSRNRDACAYGFWWNKPLNVNQSIRVFPKSEPPLEMQPRAREPIPEARKSTWEAIGKGLGTILMLIGKRMLTWVATSVAITAIPLLIVFCLQTWTSIILYFFFHPSFGSILYILPRAVTLVLAFTSLRNLPPGKYEMRRSWNSFAVSTTFFQGIFFGRSLTTSRWMWMVLKRFRNETKEKT